MQKRDVKERNDGLGMREAVTGNYDWTLNSANFSSALSRIRCTAPRFDVEVRIAE
jgi:hypothetical protein